MHIGAVSAGAVQRTDVRGTVQVRVTVYNNFVRCMLQNAQHKYQEKTAKHVFIISGDNSLKNSGDATVFFVLNTH